MINNLFNLKFYLLYPKIYPFKLDLWYKLSFYTNKLRNLYILSD